MKRNGKEEKEEEKEEEERGREEGVGDIPQWLLGRKQLGGGTVA